MEENRKHQNLLDEIRPHAGNNAYLGHGCMVCPDCENDFYWKSEYHPVQIFYNDGINRLLFLYPRVKAPENQLRRLIDYWAGHSKGQDVLKYRMEVIKRAVEDFGRLLH